MQERNKTLFVIRNLQPATRNVRRLRWNSLQGKSKPSFLDPDI